MEAVTGYGWESWHWRWIGTDAVMMQNRYFGGVQQLLLEFWDKNASPVREAMKRE
jgi:D-alanyl-D-alanine carboxypeptidase